MVHVRTISMASYMRKTFLKAYLSSRPAQTNLMLLKSEEIEFIVDR